MAKSPPAVPAGGKIHENLILGGLVAVIIAVGITRAGGVVRVRPRRPQNAARPGSGQPGGVRPLAGPAVAWGAPVGSVAVYWLLTGLLGLAALGVVFLGWQIHRSAQTGTRRDRPHHKLEGVASRAHVVAHAGSKKLLDEAKHLRPSMTKPDTGTGRPAARDQPRSGLLDRAAGLAGDRRPARCREGPERSDPVHPGLERPGRDHLDPTRQSGRDHGRPGGARGPVAVFDPQRLAPGIPSAARWSPTRGCQDEQTAMARAAGLVTDAARGTENGSFWAQQATQAVQCLLHAAALAGRPTSDLYRWSLSDQAASRRSGSCRNYATTRGRTRSPRSWAASHGSGTRSGRW